MRNRKPERLVESFNGNMYENITAICKHYGFENKFGIPVLAVALYIKNKEKIVKITEENLIFMGLLIVLDDFAKYASETTVEASSKKIITEHTFFYDESLKDIVKKFSGEDFYWENLKEVAVKVPCDLLHLFENVDFWIKLKIANIDSINLLFDILLDWKKNPELIGKKPYLREPFVLEAMGIARELHARGTIPTLHELLQENAAAVV